MSDTFRRNRPLLVALLVVIGLFALMAQRFEPRVIASILLSGLTLGALYFLVSSGLSLIFGLMDVLNFAHGLMFMIGAYLGYTSYANPRLILNVLPFALALTGGLQMGSLLSRRLTWQPRTHRWAQALHVGLWLLAAALLVAGTAGFNVLALAAGSITATGGAISTERAQEAADLMFRRTAVVGLAGMVIGLAANRMRGADATRVRWQFPLIGGAILVALAFGIIPLRTPGERALLDLSSNVRFLIALVFGAVAGAGLGALVEAALIRPLYSRPIYQVLLTLGLSFAGTELIKGVWGPAGSYMDIPEFFNGGGDRCPSPNLASWFVDHCASIDVLGRPFPSYRMFIIALGLLMFLAILILLKRTRLGIIIRAGVQDAEMVQALGINVRRVFTMVFALGTALAALGGVAAAPFIGVNLGLGTELQLQAFISVVIGGMGSFTGAAIGSLLVGLARSVTDQLVLSGIQVPFTSEILRASPSIARASTVLIMAIVLFIRPAGLFGRKD